jgi:hypothetical protein
MSLNGRTPPRLVGLPPKCISLRDPLAEAIAYKVSQVCVMRPDGID